ncbi:hypothetical protein ACTQ49_06965 [Luteococcus sp. Sow4_B9]|uniref:hypothetical protein n=1 Tax=Luteococcus sp. Sow4_B9 TaxID=3438792 RepID=UPI003F99F32D
MATSSSGIARSAGAPSRIRIERDDRWLLGEGLLAGLAVLMVAARIPIGGNLVLADPLGWVLLPLWLPALRRYKGASSIAALGVLACAASWVLTRQAAVDHHVSMQLNSTTIKTLLSMVTSLGLMLWARDRLPQRWLLALFAVGLFIAGPTNKDLFAENPWKFGYSIPMTILVVGLVAAENRTRATVGLLAFFGLVCTITDARSNFAVLLLTVVLILWRRPTQEPRRRRSVAGTLAVLGAIAVAAYYAVQAAILEGALGEATRARSEEQLRISGSLLLGGRPELGASTALVSHRPWGFGGGTNLNTQDLLVAKNGMVGLNYDPDNGYVERFMFGRGIELHSITFDLWAWCGVIGLLLALVITVQILVSLGHALNTAPVASAIVVYAALMTLWNLAFSPWIASVPIMVLALGLGLVDRTEDRPSSALRRAYDPYAGA